MRLLDLFCGAGGAGEGYRRAGFDVLSVDVVDHRHPGRFLQRDAFDVLDELAATGAVAGFRPDVVAASPPCLDHTPLRALAGDSGTGWMLRETLDRLPRLGLPYVVENVPGARALMPGALTLCGSEFGLGAHCRDGQWRQLRRHRLFVSNVWLMGAGGCCHGRAPLIGVYGNGAPRGAPRVGSRGGDPYRGNLAESRTALGIDWMSRKQLSLSIPPAYTEHIGWQLIEHLLRAAA